MASSIYKDRGWTRIKADLQQLEHEGIKVGIRSTAGSHDGVRIVDYAVYNEFGTDRIPARPFMRRSADLSYIILPRFVNYLAVALIKNKITVPQMMNRIGLFFQKHIRDTILSSKSWAVPNAPYTIKKKKSSTPLVDTGAMVGAVDYERVRR